MHYFFDFDGTLVDSMPTWAGVYIKLLDKNAVSYPCDIVKIITPLGNRGACEYCISLGLDMTVDEILEYNHQELSQKYWYEIGEKTNVTSTLKALKEKGHSLHVLTASPHVYVDPCLKRIGIFDLFENVWSIDDFGLKKDDVLIYKQAAERIGTSVKECAFVDDNLIAVATSKKSGMKAIGVFDKSSEGLKDQIKAAADVYIMDFSELL